MIARRYPHVEPLFFVVRIECVDACKLVIRRIEISDISQRLTARLAREHFVDHSISSRRAPQLHQAATPCRRRTALPSSLMRALVHGGSHTSLIFTPATPGSCSNRSVTS